MKRNRNDPIARLRRQRREAVNQRTRRAASNSCRTEKWQEMIAVLDAEIAKLVEVEAIGFRKGIEASIAVLRSVLDRPEPQERFGPRK